MTPLRLIFAGSGAFGVPTLRQLASQERYQIVQVVTQPDRASGRGRHVAATPIGQLAAELRLPLLNTADINAETLPPADVLLVIAFGQKISQPVATAPRLGSLNLHASLLPRHRGAAPIHRAILSGDRETGNSVIRLAEKMDAGAVLAQSHLPIGTLETTGELHDRLAADGPALVLATLDDLAHGRAKEQPQDPAKATLAPKLTRADAQIDWTQPAEAISRQIRAMFPWPGCRVTLTDPNATGAPPHRLTVARARPAAPAGATPPATINPNGCVAAGNGSAVEVIELLPEGGRLMTLMDYRNGHPWRAGMCFKPAR